MKKILISTLLALSFITMPILPSITTTPVQAATYHTDKSVVFFNIGNAPASHIGEVTVTYAYDNNGNCNMISYSNVHPPERWAFCYGQLSSNGQKLTLTFNTYDPLNRAYVYRDVTIYGHEVY